MKKSLLVTFALAVVLSQAGYSQSESDPCAQAFGAGKAYLLYMQCQPCSAYNPKMDNFAPPGNFCTACDNQSSDQKKACEAASSASQ